MILQRGKYLDPKNDLTFRKIFGEHPHIMKSFLNSIMPFSQDRYIETIKYEDITLIPDLFILKNSIGDVKCTDNYGRQFIVEMQMYWTNTFKSRMLFNAGKAYVKQLKRGQKYSKLLPVYGLSLVDDKFIKGKSYYHHYKLSHQTIPEEKIEGIELIFIELPKFNVKTFTEKKMRNLWLRFLTEIDENTEEISEDMLANKELNEALEYLRISAFTENELSYYEEYWDKVRTEKTAIEEAIERAIESKKIAEEAVKKQKEAEKKAEKAEKIAQEALNRLKKIEENLKTEQECQKNK